MSCQLGADDALWLKNALWRKSAYNIIHKTGKDTRSLTDTYHSKKAHGLKYKNQK